MTVTLGASEVRQLVARAFADFGVVVRRLAEMKETIFVEHGKNLARSYRHRGLMAMWLVQEGLVQFYDAEGNMLRTVNLLEQSIAQRAAA
jgi:hypothetical protein